MDLEEKLEALPQQYQSQPSASKAAEPMLIDEGSMADNQSQPAVKHDLSWLLFEGETENEILANPYIFEDDVECLLQGLFEKEQSQEGDYGQFFDIQHYYLNRMHL